MSEAKRKPRRKRAAKPGVTICPICTRRIIGKHKCTPPPQIVDSWGLLPLPQGEQKRPMVKSVSADVTFEMLRELGKGKEWGKLTAKEAANLRKAGWPINPHPCARIEEL